MQLCAGTDEYGDVRSALFTSYALLMHAEGEGETDVEAELHAFPWLSLVLLDPEQSRDRDVQLPAARRWCQPDRAEGSAIIFPSRRR